MNIKIIVLFLALGMFFASYASGQTTSYTYQGKLIDSGTAATAQYDFSFRLYSASSGGAQIGTEFFADDVPVSGGIFTVSLDFGTSPFLTNNGNYLEISVRPGAATGAYTLLSPRQPITSSPYSIQTLRAASAATADSAAVATNAANLGGTPAASFIQTSDSRLSDARTPTPGSPNYIQNGTAQQASSDFNISGNGTAAGLLSGGVVNAGTQFNIGGNRVLAAPATDNIFGGRLAGINTAGGVYNSFFGFRAGEANTGGSSNSFFGERSGLNTQSVNNSFFGAVAGQSNVGGSNNTAIGTLSDVGAPGLTYATAIGAGAVVGASNTIQLGRANGTDTVVASGPVIAQSFSGSGAVPWQVISGSQQAASNKGYLASGDLQVTITLPTSPNVGDIVRVSGTGTGGWKIAQNAGQSILGANLGLAGQNWTPRESNRFWRSVASSADGTKLAAVVSGEQIYTSTDSGATWTARESNREWRSVASSADGTKLSAVVYTGQIYTSTDSGENWTARESNRTWLSVASSADGTKLVAGIYGGQIYTSTDSGANWTAKESNRYWYSIASSADGTKLAAGVYGGQIYTSTDSGANWTVRMTDANRTWSSVASSADGTKMAAVVEGGQIYTSNDSGANWTARESNRYWQSVASSADGRKLTAVVYGGQIYTSTDSGANWTARESNRTWRSVASSADGSKLAAVVDGGQIYISVPNTTSGAAGYITGGQGTAVELQYVGSGQFLPISHEGTILGY